MLALAAPPAPPAPGMELRFDRLASALTLLSDADRKIVDEAVQLIREGEHAGALARLSTLTHSNPDNSSLRILMAYAQLQLGNLTGALDEAKKAHEAPNGNSYRCYFSGQDRIPDRRYRNLPAGAESREERRAICRKKSGNCRTI